MALRIHEMPTGAAIIVVPIARLRVAKVAGELRKPAEGAHFLPLGSLGIEHLLLLASRTLGHRQGKDVSQAEGFRGSVNRGVCPGIPGPGRRTVAGNTVAGRGLGGIKRAGGATRAAVGPHGSRPGIGPSFARMRSRSWRFAVPWACFKQRNEHTGVPNTFASLIWAGNRAPQPRHLNVTKSVGDITASS